MEQARVIWEAGTLVEKMPPLDHPSLRLFPRDSKLCPVEIKTITPGEGHQQISFFKNYFINGK